MENLFKKTNTILFVSFLIVTFYGCKKDKTQITNPQAIENEEEIITTMTLNFIDSTEVQPTFTAVFRDPDGDGGDSPVVFDSLYLKAQTTYFVTIALLNETVSPADTISNEVVKEGADHLFCFEPESVSLNISPTDSDGTLGIGVKSKWVIGSVGQGHVTISLKHQPGIKDGTCTPGDTDVEVRFVTMVQ